MPGVRLCDKVARVNVKVTADGAADYINAVILFPFQTFLSGN